MGGQLVTGELPETGGGEVDSPAPVFSYAKKFEELCSVYLAFGMSYSEYWDGEADLARYARESYKLKKQAENESAWLHGLYVYHAIADCAPILNPMAKKHEIEPYLSEPFVIEEREKKRKEKEKRDAMTRGCREYVEMFAAQFNKRFENKEQEVTNDGN